MKPGDRVKIALKNIIDDTDHLIDGKEGILHSNNLDPDVPFDFCVRIGNMLFGINESELAVIERMETDA